MFLDFLEKREETTDSITLTDPVRSFMRSRGIERLYGSRSTVALSGNGCS